MNLKATGLATLAVLAVSTQSSLAAPIGGESAVHVPRFGAAANTRANGGAAEIAGITFTSDVSTVAGSLPLFRLSPSAAPTAFVSSALNAARNRGTATAGALGVENARLVARDAHGVMKAYVDGVTGDAAIFPDLTATTNATHHAAAVSAQAAAGAIFSRPDVIPQDSTQARLGGLTPIYSSAAKRGAIGKSQPQSAPQKLFTYVAAERYAAGLPVVGQGSHATVALDADGAVRGLVRRWETAHPAGTVASSLTPAQLENAIATQLHSLQNADNRITVDSVKPAYYDGNAKFLQPVYQFFATLHPRAGRTGDEHVVGYVPVGKLLEPIPVLGKPSAHAPVAPHASLSRGSRFRANADPSMVALGQYANRDGSMLDMADAYVNGFDSVPAWWYGAPIVRTQWYWAYPFEVESDANYYMNAVQVAYTQPHGDWYLNTTYSNWADLWYVNQIGVNGNPGYGAAAGGELATWIIDSCEVIPSFYDMSVSTGNGYDAFNVWWQVFQGLHRAIGFRTEMLLGFDTMNYQIAQDMAEGADPNSSFFTEVANADFDQYGTYGDYHLNYLQVRYDRASIMYDPRNAGESIYDVQGQDASGSLTNVWMDN